MKAFPLLARGGGQKLREVAQGTVLEDALAGVFACSSAAPKERWVQLNVGLEAWFEVVGLLGDAKNSFVLHAPGLPAGFAVPEEDMRAFAARLELTGRPEHPQNGIAEVTVAEAIATCAQRGELGSALHSILAALQRKHLTVLGHERGKDIGLALLHDSRCGNHKLDFGFRYHVGLDQSVAVAVDNTAATCGRFGVRSGQKILSPLGVAACVGVAEMAGAAAPQLLWHVSGHPAAAVVPALHVVSHVDVGEAKLEFNGPHDGSLLLAGEEPTRYLNPDERADGYDTSQWLCKGLFAAEAGAPHPTFAAELEVLGVGAADAHNGLDLFCKHMESGKTRSLSEWALRL